MNKRTTACFVAMALAGCIVDLEEGDDITELDLDQETRAATATNGTSVNGTSINGTSINGTSINGTSINGTSINGVSFSGGQLVATTSTGTLSGAQLVGSELSGTTTSGTTLTMRIDSATAIKTDQWAYGVSVKSSGVWSPLCESTSILAYAISGTWDYRSEVAGAGGPIADATKFTWACRTKGAIAKCIDLGYAPWRTVSGTLLRDHHTACVRMIRGDYCGTGTTYTTDGNTINVYDNKKIQTDAKTWPLDAEWKATGARCIRKTRTFSIKPPCADNLMAVSTCGTLTNSLMIDEFLGS